MPIKKAYVRESGKSRGSPKKTKTTGFGKSNSTNKVNKTEGSVMEDVAVAVDNQQVVVVAGEVSDMRDVESQLENQLELNNLGELNSESLSRHDSDWEEPEELSSESLSRYESELEEPDITVSEANPVSEEVIPSSTDNGGIEGLLKSPTGGQVDDIETFLQSKEEFTTLHFVDGEKGGVGKSLFCRVLLEYCNRKNWSEYIDFVESDLSNPDVGLIYYGQDKYRTVEFSLEERKRSEADHLFELAMRKSVIVNLPSNIFSAVKDWLDRNHVISLGAKNDYKVGVCKWFVCTGSPSSTEKFKESVRTFEGRIIHVLVKNGVIHDNWPVDKELQDLIDKYKIVQVSLPRFDFTERNNLESNFLTFGKALKAPGFTILSKQRIKNFLDAAFEGLDKLELLP